MPNRSQTRAAVPSHRAQAALFIDYDNLYTALKNKTAGTTYPDEYINEIINELRRYLEEGDDTPTLVARAYADFGMLAGEDGSYIQHKLHQAGIDPRLTPASMQDNAAELQLCLEVAGLLRDRPDIETFVIVTGYRRYLPLVRCIREHGRRALVAALFPPDPSETPHYAEDDVFLDARNLLRPSSLEDLMRDDQAYTESAASSTERRTPARASAQRVHRPITNPFARRTVEITEEHFGQYKEVYLTPLLRKLSEVLGDEHDPKSLVSELEAAGAVRLEKRSGYPYDYTVLILHTDHPDVQEIQSNFYASRHDEGTWDDADADRDYGDDYDQDYDEASYEEESYRDEEGYDEDYDEAYNGEYADEGYDEYDEPPARNGAGAEPKRADREGVRNVSHSDSDEPMSTPEDSLEG